MNRYVNAYFSYILIRIKGSGSCSRTGDTGDYALIPNGTGKYGRGWASHRSGGWLWDITGAICQPTEYYCENQPWDKAGIGGISFSRKCVSPQTTGHLILSINPLYRGASIAGDSRQMADFEDVHNACYAYTQGAEG